jgi:hypothetical protein
MAAGDIAANSKKRINLGAKCYQVVATIETNGTAEVTFDTGLNHIINVQLTWAEAPANPTTSVLYASSVSGGVVGIKSAAASGSKDVYVTVLGW